MRVGNNTEAFDFSFDKDGRKLMETLRVNRSFPTKYGVRLIGTLELDGFVEVVATGPDKSERVDLTEAVDALIEDELYQMNAHPVPSMRSLTCVRNGWEGEEFVMGDNGPEVRVGLTLITPSRKQVVNVTAVMTKNSNSKWTITDYSFEPFLPYRSW
jgi:hypothetical protein